MLAVRTNPSSNARVANGKKSHLVAAARACEVTAEVHKHSLEWLYTNCAQVLPKLEWQGVQSEVTDF